MAVTTEFNQLLMTLVAADLDTNAERLAIDNVVSTGAGNELDFGNVNISGGQIDSDPKAVCWQVSAWSTHTQVENFRFWLSSNGFDDAPTVIKHVDWKLDSVSEWETSPTPPLSGEADLPEAEPAQNIHQGGDGTTTSITSGDNDTSEAICNYVYVGASESVGTFKGTDSGFEFQYSFKYDYF